MLRYINKNSIIHKLNSTIKVLILILLSVVIFTLKSYLYLSLIMVIEMCFVILTKIHIKYYLKHIKYTIYFILITFTMNMIFLSDLSYSLMLSYRIFIMLILTQIFVFTTESIQIGKAVANILTPLKIFKIKTEEINIIVTIALSFMPILSQEFNSIKLAQKAKGYKPSILNIKKYILCIFIPFMNNCFKRTDEISMALIVKGYNDN